MSAEEIAAMEEIVKHDEERSMSPIVAEYERLTMVDNEAVYAEKLAKLAGLVVSKANIEDAAETRKKIGYIKRDAGDVRMQIQRAIKDHPIGKFAFTPTPTEKYADDEYKRLGSAIEAVKDEGNPAFRYMIDVKATAAQFCKIQTVLNKMSKETGLQFAVAQTAMDADVSEIGVKVEADMV